MRELQISGGYKTLIDDEDYLKVSQFKWQAFKIKHKEITYVYVSRRPVVNGKKTIVYLHRFILDETNPKVIVDHKDGNTLNNTKNNLRKCTKQQNVFNCYVTKWEIPYKGVCRAGDSFRVRIRFRGFRYGKVEVGTFNSSEQAAKEYDKFALFLRGEFANLNFPEKRTEYLEEIKQNRSFYLDKIKD